MRDLLEDTAQRAIRYLSELDARSVDAPSGAVARLSELDRAFPDEPTSPQDVIRLLDDVGSPATVASAGRRYFGFVTGGSLPAAVAANWLAGAWDQNAHFVVGSPIAAAVEKVALRWITEALSLPASWGGSFVTGTTMGNFTGLAAARHAVLDRSLPGPGRPEPGSTWTGRSASGRGLHRGHRIWCRAWPRRTRSPPTSTSG
jgi:glutamate/tyrosine decarboxylase-like PLP-dependent enzyme